MVGKTIKKWWPVFVLPTLAAFVIGFLWPFIWGIYLSFCKFTTVKDVTFVGFSNYTKILLDKSFSHAFCLTVIFAFVSSILKQIRNECVCVSSASRENDWKFYLYKPRSFIEESVFRLLLSEIPLILVCVLIIFVLGLVFSRIFTRRIERLTENMNRVNHGSRVVTVYSDSEDGWDFSFEASIE